jgi:hypothetical protein
MFGREAHLAFNVQIYCSILTFLFPALAAVVNSFQKYFMHDTLYMP